MARQKSYNDIKRQVERLQNSRFADRARRIGDSYMSRARRASYWESRYRQPGTEGYFDGEYYGYNNDKKHSRSAYSGKSDAQFYADELRRGRKFPKSIYKKSEAIRSGKTSVKDYLKGKNGAISIGQPERFWNHYITGFSNVNGKLYARVYAQGDDIDTTDSVLIDDIERGNARTYLNESFRNGYSHRLTFNITKEDLNDARKRLADTVKEQEELNYAKRMIDRKNTPSIADEARNARTNNNASTAAQGNSGG